MHSLKVSKCSSRQGKQTPRLATASDRLKAVWTRVRFLSFNSTVFSEAPCRWRDNAAPLNIKL